MKTHKIGFYLRLVLIFSGLFLFSFFLGILVLKYSFNFFPRYLQEKQDMLTSIKTSLIEAIHHNPDLNINDFLHTYNQEFSQIELNFLSPAQIHVIRFRNTNRFFIKLPNGRKNLVVAERIRVRQQTGYLVLYSKNSSPLSSSLRVISVLMIFIFLTSLILGLFILRWFYRRTAPLITAAGKLSTGDYQTRIPIEGQDEFSLVGTAFNQMASSIENFTAELKTIDRQRRQFIADISHELATPLTSIKGYLEVIGMQKLEQAAQRENLHVIEDETERLLAFVKQLLEMARIDAGTIRLEKEAIDCQQLFSRIKKRNELRLNKHQVEFAWKTKDEQYIWADCGHLEQIFQNLLDNALKHSLSLKKIVVSTEKIADFTMITFTDDGDGIAIEHLPHIFNRFYKVSRGDGTPSGSGLGLAIVKDLVELHHGTISVTSTPGQGTTFTIKLPIFV